MESEEKNELGKITGVVSAGGAVGLAVATAAGVGLAIPIAIGTGLACFGYAIALLSKEDWFYKTVYDWIFVNGFKTNVNWRLP